MDGEHCRVVAQRPQLPALKRQVGVRLLHQHKRLKGRHPEGDFGFSLLMGKVHDAAHPPRSCIDASESLSFSEGIIVPGAVHLYLQRPKGLFLAFSGTAPSQAASQTLQHEGCLRPRCHLSWTPLDCRGTPSIPSPQSEEKHPKIAVKKVKVQILAKRFFLKSLTSRISQ